MVIPVFASPAPEFVLVSSVGVLFVLLVTGLFVKATRTRRKKSEQNRRAGLGLMAIVCGPIVGASLAWVANVLGNVHPADVRYTFAVLTTTGEESPAFSVGLRLA